MKGRSRHAVENVFDDGRNAGKRQPALEKRRDGHFVGSIQGARQRAPRRSASFASARQGNFPSGTSSKSSLRGARPIERAIVGRNAFRVGERVLERHAHVGGPELRQDRAIHKFDHGMNGRLRMDDHVNFVEVHAEEPARFDHFEALVHERGGVDGDALAHFPVGMRQGLLGRHFCELGGGGRPKRAAGSGEDQALHFPVIAGAQALMNGVVLAIDREEARRRGGRPRP